jgi:pimeloyl-ACP methyl ester carboxylesterase
VIDQTAASVARYARCGDASIAYRVDGQGPVDVLIVPGIVSHVEFMHELPGYTRFITALGEFARVITFDKRGNGLSDPVLEAPSLEERMDDARAVLDAVGSVRAVLLGVSEGAPLATLFAATYPERTRALALFGGFARIVAAAGYTAGLEPEIFAQVVDTTVRGWGTGAPLTHIFGLSCPDAGEMQSNTLERAARCERLSATPTMLRRLWAMTGSIDVRDVLPRVRVPTLVLHREGDGVIPVRAGRYLADHIDGARFVALEGQPHFPFVGDIGPTVRELRAIVGAPEPTPVSETLMAPLREPPPRELQDQALARLLRAKEDEPPPTEIGRFVIDGLLGRGGMGSIYLAVDRDLERKVALKLLHVTDAAALRRFRQEALAVARVSHANVVSIYEFGLDAAVPYLVMEYVQGGAASSLVERVSWQRATRIVRDAARGLGAAHALGIVHRDVKPDNLLLVHAAGDAVKVADFGIAKLSGSGEVPTAQRVVVGTVGYLSPEQARGDVVDARSDVYSLAVTWYRLLTGRAPFDVTLNEALAAPDRAVPDPREHVPEIPAAIAALVRQMGAIKRDDRPADGRAVVELLDATLE